MWKRVALCGLRGRYRRGAWLGLHASVAVMHSVVGRGVHFSKDGGERAETELTMWIGDVGKRYV